MAFRRHNILKSGLNGLAEKHINDNFMNLFAKLSGGNINYADLDNNVKRKINTQWFPIQMEGNLDANFPLEHRVYIPPNIKELKSAKLSAVISAYRMDSDIALSDDVLLDIKVNIDLSTSSAIIGQTTSGGGGAISESLPVMEWGPMKMEAPTKLLVNAGGDLVQTPGTSDYWGYVSSSKDKTKTLGTQIMNNVFTSRPNDVIYYADMWAFQHTHMIKVPSHSHSISGAIASHGHTGSAIAKMPKHSHKLNEGIKVSSKRPSSVEIQINGRKIGKTMSGVNDTQTDIDFMKQLNIGKWNTIKVIASTPSRVSIYGIIEAEQDLYY